MTSLPHGAPSDAASGRAGDGLPLDASAAARAERTARTVLYVASAVLLGLFALVALGLALAPKDDSTLGLMKALVFRCH